MDISVVVTTHNQKERLRLVLAGLRGQIASVARFEVVVVDDGSSDGTAKMLDSVGRQMDLKIVRLRPNEGRCVARNRGVEAATGAFVAFLDGDALPHPHWLQGHIEALEQGGRESLLCGAGYSLPGLEYLQDPQRGTPMEDKTPSVVREYLRVHRQDLILTEDMVLTAFDHIEARAVIGWYPFPELELLQEQITELFVQYSDSPIGWLGFFPNNGVVLREAFLEVGGFDPAMAFSEGWDLAYRLQKYGCRPCFVPEARAYHLYHYHDFSDPIKAHEEMLAPQRAMRYMEQKHSDPKLLMFHFWYASIWPDPLLPEETLLGDLVEFHQAYAHWPTSRLRDLRTLLDHHPIWAELSEARIP
jgi:glycosyltransferase involved in cell wall biosynthesis